MSVQTALQLPGYNPLLVSGMIHLVPDVFTGQCATDFQNLYNYLVTRLPDDIELLYPAQFSSQPGPYPTYLRHECSSPINGLALSRCGRRRVTIFIIQINGALSLWYLFSLSA